MVTPGSLAIVMAPATAVEEGGATVVGRGARLPATVTVQNFIVIRPTAPAALGDGDAATGVTLSYAPVVNPLNPAGGSIEIVASTIADVPLPPGQTITHLRFRALAYSFEDQTSAPGLTNYRMGWKVGANAVEGVVTNEDPGWTYLNPVRRDVDGLDVGDSTVPNYYVSTGNITTRPGGGAWTAADVNALVDVALRLTYAAGTEFLDLTVAEFLIEVHGQIGSAPVVISVPQKMGRLVRHRSSTATCREWFRCRTLSRKSWLARPRGLHRADRGRERRGGEHHRQHVRPAGHERRLAGEDDQRRRRHPRWGAGTGEWAGIGDSATYVSVADLGSKARARFKLRVKWTDSAGKVDFGDEMLWDWVEPPI